MNSINKFTLILFLIVLSSCAKDDSINEDNVEEQVEPEIGLTSYGRGLTSFDEGVRIFKTNEGYISFEIYNKTIASATYEGTSDIVVRKVNEELELMEEQILETSSYEYLNDVVQIDGNTYAVVFSVMFSNPFDGPISERLSTPYIGIFNSNGEILEIEPLGDFEPLNFGREAEVTYQNGRLYVSIYNSNIDTTNAVQRIIAFDTQLNELWKNEITMPEEYREGKIQVGNDLYNIYSKEGIEENSWIFVLSRFNLSNGELIDSIEYEQENTKLLSVQKLIQNQNDLVVVGLFVDSFGFTDESQGFFKKISMSDWSEGIFTLIEYDIYSSNIIPNNILANDNEFIVSNSAQSNFDVVKLDSQGKVIWTANATGFGYVKDFLIRTDGSITFLGSLGNNESSTRQVMLGMFDANGELK